MHTVQKSINGTAVTVYHRQLQPKLPLGHTQRFRHVVIVKPVNSLPS